MWNPGPVRGHEIRRLDGTDGDDRFVGSTIPHDTDRLDGKKDGEDLIRASIEIPSDDLLQENLIAFADDIQLVPGYLTKNTDSQTRTGKRMPPYDVRRQAKDLAKRTDLVLEKLAKRLDELETQILGQSTHIVMQLDVGSLPGMPVARFDDIRIQGALSEKTSFTFALWGPRPST